MKTESINLNAIHARMEGDTFNEAVEIGLEYKTEYLETITYGDYRVIATERFFAMLGTLVAASLAISIAVEGKPNAFNRLLMASAACWSLSLVFYDLSGYLLETTPSAAMAVLNMFMDGASKSLLVLFITKRSQLLKLIDQDFVRATQVLQVVLILVVMGSNASLLAGWLMEVYEEIDSDEAMAYYYWYFLADVVVMVSDVVHMLFFMHKMTKFQASLLSNPIVQRKLMKACGAFVVLMGCHMMNVVSGVMSVFTADWIYCLLFSLVLWMCRLYTQTLFEVLVMARQSRRSSMHPAATT